MKKKVSRNSVVICIICVFASFAGFSGYYIYPPLFAVGLVVPYIVYLALKKNYEEFLSQIFSLMCLIPGLCFFGFFSTRIWLFLLPALFFLIPAYLSSKKALEESLQSKVVTKRA